MAVVHGLLPLLHHHPHRQPSGTAGYPDLHRDAVDADLYDATVEEAALADVIGSKQVADRSKDQRTLPTLRELPARHSD